MAVRTIGVSVTGKGELEKVAKLVSSIKSNLAGLEKELAGLEGPAVSIRVGLASKGILGETKALANMLSNHKDTGVKLRVSLKSKGLIKEVRNISTNLQKELDGVSIKIEGKKNKTSNNSTSSTNPSVQSSSNKKSNTKKPSSSGGGNRLSIDEIKERNDLALQKKAHEAQIQVNKAREIAQIKAEADAQKRFLKAQEDERKLRVKQQQERERAERQAQRDAERRASKEEKHLLVADARERKQREIANLPNTYRRIINDRVGRDKKEAVETYFSYMDEVSKDILAKYSEGPISTREAILNNNPIIVSQLLAKHYNDKLNLNHYKHRTVESKGLLMDENDKYSGVPLAFDGTILHGTRALAKELAKLDDALESFGAPEEVRRAAKEVYEIIGMTTDEVEELNDRFLESMKALETIGQLADSLSQKLIAFAGTSLDKGFVLPLRTLTGIYTQSARQMVSMSLNTGQSIGHNLYQGFHSGFSSILSYARQTLGAMVQDARELSDAMTNYRNNMSVFGLDDSDINRNIKDLGDYGRKTVYDSADLLNMSSNYIALGYSSEEASKMVKAMAGLVANRKDSDLGISKATKQLEQIFTKGKASTEDLNTMRQWFNALGVNKFNEGLKKIAKDKGYSNLNKAIKEGKITSSDIQKLVVEVGMSESLQKLVNNIATPLQAISNLRETLANLLAYDRVTENPDGTFTRSDAPLTKLYKSTTNFIKGLTEVASGERFAKYLTVLGNTSSEFIDGLIVLGKSMNNLVGSSFISGLENLATTIVKKFSTLRVNTSAINFIDTLSVSLTNLSQYAHVPELLSDLAQGLFELSGYLVSLGELALLERSLDFLTDWLDLYQNLSKVVINSNAVSLVDDILGFIPRIVNPILNASVVDGNVRDIVTSLTDLFEEVGRFIDTIIIPSQSVSIALGVIESLINFGKNVSKNIRTQVNPSELKRFLLNIKSAIDYMLDELSKIYVVMARNIVRAGSSESGKRFFKTLADFVVSVNEGIVRVFSKLGNGNVSRGLERVLDFLSDILALAMQLVDVISQYPIQFISLYGLTKAISFLTTVGNGILSLQEALKIFNVFKGSGGEFATGFLPSVGGVFKGGKVDTINRVIGSSKNVYKNTSKFIKEQMGDSYIKRVVQGVKSNYSRYVDQQSSFGYRDAKKFNNNVQAIFERNKLPKNFQNSVLRKASLDPDKYINQIGEGNYVKSLREVSSQVKNLKGNINALSRTYKPLRNLKVFNVAKSEIVTSVKSSKQLLKATKDLVKVNFAPSLRRVKGGLLKGLTSFKGDLISMGVDFGSQVVDGFVQSSNASDNTKKVSSAIRKTIGFGTSIWGAASIGATLGSFIPGIGTGIGALIGGAYGFVNATGTLIQDGYKDKKAEERKRREAEEAAKKQLADDNAREMEYLRSRATGLSEIMRNFYASATTGKNSTVSLANASGLVQSVIASKGNLSAGGMLGLENEADKASLVDTAYAKIGNENIKLSEIRDTLGVTNEELIQALQVMYGESNEMVFALTDAEGKTVAQLKTYSDKFIERYNGKAEKFRKYLRDNGFDPALFGNLGNTKEVVERISDIEDVLENGNNGSYATKEDYKEALVSAIAQGNVQLADTIRGKSIEELEKMASGIADAASKMVKTNEELYLDMVERIAEVANIPVEEAMKLAGKTLDEAEKTLKEKTVQRVLKDKREYLNEYGKENSKEQKNYEEVYGLSVGDKKFQNHEGNINNYLKKIRETPGTEGSLHIMGLKTYLKKNFKNMDQETLDLLMKELLSGSGNIREAAKEILPGVKASYDESKKDMQTKGTELFLYVSEKLDEGIITMEQAEKALVGVDTTGVSTEGLSEASKALKEKTDQKVKDAEGHLDTAIKSLYSSSIQYEEDTSLEDANKRLAQAVKREAKKARDYLNRMADKFTYNRTWNDHDRYGMAQTLNLWAGGEVQYRANGGSIFKSRATDTVPAMLTPGEFVIRKRAAESVGVDFLRNLNANGNKALHNTSNRSIIYNVYNNNNARVNQNIDNKSQYLNGMQGLDRLMRYV